MTAALPFPRLLSLPEAERLLCRCFRVTETEVTVAIQAHGAQEVEDVMRHTGAGEGCRACHCRIKRLLAGQSADCTRICQTLGICTASESEALSA